MGLMSLLGVVLILSGAWWLALRLQMRRRALQIVGKSRKYSVLRVDVGDGDWVEVPVPESVHQRLRPQDELRVWVRERPDELPVVLYGSWLRVNWLPLVISVIGVMVLWRDTSPASFEDTAFGTAWDVVFGFVQTTGWFVVGIVVVGVLVVGAARTGVAIGRFFLGTDASVEVVRSTWRLIDEQNVDVSLAYLELPGLEPIEIVYEEKLPVGSVLDVRYVPRWPDSTWKVVRVDGVEVD